MLSPVTSLAPPVQGYKYPGDPAHDGKLDTLLQAASYSSGAHSPTVLSNTNPSTCQYEAYAGGRGPGAGPGPGSGLRGGRVRRRGRPQGERQGQVQELGAQAQGPDLRQVHEALPRQQ